MVKLLKVVLVVLLIAVTIPVDVAAQQSSLPVRPPHLLQSISVDFSPPHLSQVTLPDTLWVIQHEKDLEAAHKAEEEALKLKEAQYAAAALNSQKSLAVTQVRTDLTEIQQKAKDILSSTYPTEEWQPFYLLVMSESGFNPRSLNRSSGACGIPQALPCSKLPQGINTSVEDQIKWTIEYIKDRYGSPSAAWSYHLHTGWY